MKYYLFCLTLLSSLFYGAVFDIRSSAADEKEPASKESAPPLNINFKTRYLFSINAVASDYPFSDIKDIFVDGKHEELYILDNGNKRCVITDLNGTFLYQFKYADAGVKGLPVGIAAAEDGLLYVAEGKRVVVASYRGAFKREMNISAMPDADKISIQSIAVEGDTVYLGDVGNKRIVAMNRKKDELIAEFKDLQFQDKKYNRLRQLKNFYIASSADGLYANDPANFSVFIIDRKDGKPLGAFGEVSSLPGGFSMPVGMNVDRKTGRIFVVDFNRLALIIFSKEGEFLFEIGGESLFGGPNAVAAYNDRVYVSDSGRIRAFQIIEEPVVIETEAEKPAVAEPQKDEVSKIAEEKGRLLHVYFPEGSVEFREANGEILDRNVRWLMENPDAKIEIRGYADDRKSDELNIRLSEERAKTAADYMIKRGIDPKRFKQIKGYGGVSMSAGDTDLPKKRVDFIIVK